MPTIEIVSVNSKGLDLNQEEFKLAIREEKKLISHRGLFYDELISQKGVIVHLGNPEMKNDASLYFASAIIDWSFEDTQLSIPEVNTKDSADNWGANQAFLFKFLDFYIEDIDKILKIALEKSPIKRVYFLTDFQLGPENGKTEIIYTLSDFWEKHNDVGLTYNTKYEIYGL